ncbi:MAG: hypothetical protein AB1420_12180 [Bacillota bacterium]
MIDKREDTLDKGWIKLASLSGEIDADLLVGLLKAHDIPALKVYPSFTQPMKVYMGTAIGVEVHVQVKDYHIAKDLMKEIDGQC